MFRQEAAKDSNASLLRLSTEALLVEGLSSLVAAAAGFISSPGREEDVHALLHALIEAFSRHAPLRASQIAKLATHAPAATCYSLGVPRLAS